MEEKLKEDFPGVIEGINYRQGIAEIRLVNGNIIFVSPITEEAIRESIRKALSKKELSFSPIEAFEVGRNKVISRLVFPK